jgi:thymidylate synthase (FAD)
MKVNLISYTPNAEELCAKIARYTRVEEDWETIDRKQPKDGWAEMLKRVIASGHTSILEHAVFTFEISGVSRVTTHQLVRHRIASYAQKSNRVLRPKEIIIPESVMEVEGYNHDLLEEAAMRLFKDMYRAGVPEEDARYLSPSGTATAIIMTVNARELYEVIFPQRLDKTAQWEIRTLANKMLKLVKPIMPSIFEKFVVDKSLAGE